MENYRYQDFFKRREEISAFTSGINEIDNYPPLVEYLKTLAPIYFSARLKRHPILKKDQINKIEFLEDMTNLDHSNLRNVKEYASALLPLQENDLEALKAYAAVLSFSDKDAEAHLNIAMLLERYEMPWPSYLLLSEGIKLDALPEVHAGFHGGLLHTYNDLRHTRLSNIPLKEMEELWMIHSTLAKEDHTKTNCFFLTPDFEDKEKRKKFYKEAHRKVFGEQSIC